MSNIAHVRMTLTGALAGKTITLNKCRFVSGMCEDMIHVQDIRGLRKYFTSTYQVVFEVNPTKTAQPEVEAEAEPKLPEMDERQEKVLNALYQIPRSEWDDGLPIPRPAVSLVAEIANDPALNQEELIDVIEIWYGKVQPTVAEEAPVVEEPVKEEPVVEEPVVEEVKEEVVEEVEEAEEVVEVDEEEELEEDIEEATTDEEEGD